MKLLNKADSLGIIKQIDEGIDPKDHSTFAREGKKHICIKYPPVDAINYLSYLVAFTDPFSSWKIALLTDWSIFPQYENTFLYYSLRKMNMNNDHIFDSPGHLFLPHEQNELFSLISICILNSYDLVILENNDYSRYKLCHDGFIDVYTSDEDLFASLNKMKTDRRL